MLYRLVRPMRRRESRSVYFMQRIPADVKARAIGLKLELPVGSETVPLSISSKASFKKVSLRSAEPTEAKVRHATLAAYLETVWRAVREDAPIPLTHRQTALAGRLYRAWASGEGRERTTSVIVMRGGDWRPDGESADDLPDVWEKAGNYLDGVEQADGRFLSKADSGDGRRARGRR